MFKLSTLMPLVLVTILNSSTVSGVLAKPNTPTIRPSMDTLLLGTEPRIEFDAKKWLDPKAQASRMGMLPDLMHSYELVGLKRSSVHELLGEPDATAILSKAYLKGDAETYNVPLFDVPTCGNVPGSYLDIEYFHNKVRRIRYKQTFGGGNPGRVTVSQWVNKNMSWQGDSLMSVSPPE